MEQCYTMMEVADAIRQWLELGWTVTQSEQRVTFFRPDGVTFLWDWITDKQQFCRVTGTAL